MSSSSYTVQEWFNSIPDLNIRKTLFEYSYRERLKISYSKCSDAIMRSTPLFRDLPNGSIFWINVTRSYSDLKIKLSDGK